MYRARNVLVSLSLVGLVLLVSLEGLRADVTGSILGVVKDGSGAVLPGVSVTATHVSTGLIRSTQTDATGQYEILSLPIGNYKVEGSLSGFQSFVTTGIDLTVNEQRRVDITLQVGGVEQRIEVNA